MAANFACAEAAMLPFGTPPQGWIDDRKILADAAIRLPYVARGIEPDVSFGHSLGPGPATQMYSRPEKKMNYPRVFGVFWMVRSV